MSIKLVNILKGDGKYFAVVFFILFLLLLTGIFSPILVNNLKENWKNELGGKISNIRNSVTEDYRDNQSSLLKVSEELKKNLEDTLKPGNISYGSLVQLVNKDENEEYSIEIIAPDGRIIAWNETIAIPQENIFPLNFSPGEAYFYNSPLITYLTVTDTLSIQNDLFYFIVSIPFEKKYSFRNSYFKRINFTRYLADKYLTQFDIDYESFASPSKDGREYSFDLLNNKDNKIAVVNFIKPALDTSVNSLKESIQKVQSILWVLLILFIFAGLKNEFKKIKFRTIKFFVVVIYCCIFRGIMFWIGFPSNILQENLTRPAYFSSTFGWGIVKSPVEFSITCIFLLIISVVFFKLLSNYLKEQILKNKSAGNLKFLLIIPLTFVFLLTLRGLSASVKSVIFDSTLRYFKSQNLFPYFPIFVMDLNVLLLGLSAVLILSGCILFAFTLIYSVEKKKLIINYLSLLVFFQAAGFVFLFFQKEPLLTPLLGFFFILFIFVFSYYAGYSKIDSVYNYVYAMLTASVITITLMNFYNLELERQSLKTTALEINRPNDNLFKFLINETLSEASTNENIINSFSDMNTNFDSKAFIIWSTSVLQRESLNSSVSILDSSGALIGNFAIGSGTPSNIIDKFSAERNKPNIVEFVNLQKPKEKIFGGIIPVEKEGKILGYISSVINFDEKDLNSKNYPEFLESRRNYFNTVLDIDQLKIFEITDSKLSAAYGDIYPSRKEIEPIINHDFSTTNDAWLKLNLSGENYFTYVLKNESDNGNSLTSVSLKEKDISWNLFNFFKIFILHSIIIIFLFLVLFFINFKKFKYSFRIQLLFAFLFISIFPVIILAVYNRQIVNERSKSAVFEELNERSDYIVNHVRFQLERDSERSFVEAFDNAAKELGISFTIYENTSRIFSSKEEYYINTLFESKLNPQAYYFLSYLTYREYLTQQKIEDYNYNAFYKKVNIEGSDFIIEVNDAFNKVKLTFSSIDVDVFLFGVYSFAAIIIIIVSTFLANKISLPIRRLTNATGSVAHGDLNVEIVNKEKGELKELLEGFNFMTRELRKNQVELAEMERENAWKEMAKQVAHEIKNPLTPMKLAVQQLIASYRDKDKNKDASTGFQNIFEKVSATILNQIENLSLIASEFSRFAKMPTIRLETLNLIPVINDTINLFADENIKIEFENNLKEAIIEADKTQLRRLFINLIRNSIQAGASEIQIKMLKEENDFILFIKDNGNGIPEENRDKIFETNFTTKEKGMGLGLKLAKRFLEGIKGNIILSESSQNYTIFKVQIPQKNENDLVNSASS